MPPVLSWPFIRSFKSGSCPVDYPVFAQSLTGYSGGGKKLIAVYESGETPDAQLKGPRHYALNLNHKHLAEMQKVTGLQYPPLFTPIVGQLLSRHGGFHPLAVPNDSQENQCP